MTDNNHPITPPPKLVQQWTDGWYQAKVKHDDLVGSIATQAARWGADQELEACCEWLQDPDLNVDTYKLRATRRPKPPSLKELALAEMELLETEGSHAVCMTTLRRAIESLPS